MAYVYGNSANSSIALIVFGLIEITMFVCSYFGCKTDLMDSYYSMAWSGGLAVWTGLVGICMVKCYKESGCGPCFCLFSLLTFLASVGNIVLIAGFVMLKEWGLESEHYDETGIFDWTGTAIYGVGVLAGIAILITSMVSSCFCCCCEKSPGKGYTVSNVEYTEHRDNDHNANYRNDTTV